MPGLCTIRVALLGLGNVGRAFAELVRDKSAELERACSARIAMCGVASRRIGWRANPAGLDPGTLARGDIEALHRETECAGLETWLDASGADALLEATSLNRRTGEPAVSHVRAALARGRHAISANKGPVVFAYEELTELARSNACRFLFESSVMDGVPIFSLFRESLPLLRPARLRGVLNSTCNVVLEEMERGRSREEAVRAAQALGVAETDPGDDLEGWDAAVKVAALARVLMGVPLRLSEVRREGILGLSAEELRRARAEGRVWKQVCEAQAEGGTVRASVAPQLLAADDPLARVAGTSSSVHFDLPGLFGLTLTEHHPGPLATAYGLYADLLRAAGCLELSRRAPGGQT